ncbi:MAG: aspartyl/asparaginyl beta-hydroxylase domain-containing protein [Gammaproteobacteria bacterium]|nr:aspartyl/asparaginyl beta-hydroxylase domain-containing protein [Gammaproteobacteria bacterium]MBQ0841177.1 aspartyl/asparaginyl beta-hydroxylase domain-containing protein [Gammaproteobacteria bacterium]
MTLSVLLIIILFSLGAMAYVYGYRGTTRYDNLSEYVRKGWAISAPLNCLLYLFTQKRGRKPIQDLNEFQELEIIKANWQMIRDEGCALLEQGTFETLNQPGAVAYYDVGFRTFHKYGWRKFYLTWYGYHHKSARQLCPKTQQLLGGLKFINGAMFTVIAPHSQLSRHSDPVACSLRYHLGLATPNSDQCFINVDGQSYSWRDGEALLFDETYIHYVLNDTDQSRLVLMCDVERPMNLFGRAINVFYKALIGQTVVPNTAQDKAGLVNRVFRGLVPALAKSKALKKINPFAYRVLKYSVNSSLLLMLLGITVGLITLTGRVVF